MLRVLSPVIKLTESCNLACRYCYQEGSHATGRNMTPITMDRIFSELARVCRRPLSLLWYGGEPTLVGLQAFKEALQRADKHLGREEVRHSIQTNGLLIDQPWADLLASRQFRVRLSMDGPEWLHDQQRPNQGGQGSHRQVVRALEILTQAGVKTRVACTVTRAALTRAPELIDFFSSLPLTELDFSPALRFQGSLPEEWITGAEYGEFLIQATDSYMGLAQTQLRIRILAGLVRRLSGLPAGYCKLEGDCSRFVTFGWDGRVYPCDEFSGLADYCLGNIQEQSLEQLLAQRPPLPSAGSSACRECRWEDVCPGSLCPFERMMNGGTKSNSVLCAGWKRLLEHLAPRLAPSPALLP